MTLFFFLPRFVVCVGFALAFGAPAFARNLELIPAQTAWKYSADGFDLGTSWRSPAYDDSSWPAGLTQIGYGERDEKTALAAGVNPRPITTYFRREFHVPEDAAVTALFLRLVRDDGAVIYINGVEVLRSGMPESEITSTTLASPSAEYPVENRYVLARLPAAALLRGRNVAAVEIHQASDGDPDMSFDLELVGSQYASPAFVTRGPYLQNATPEQVTVRWRTDVPTASHVRVGRTVGSQSQRFDSAEQKTEHAITVTGLTPQTRYFYTIGDGAVDLVGGDAAHSFQTAPVQGAEKPLRIWVLGDSGTGRDGSGNAEAVRDAYLRSPIFARADVWLMLGDNAYNVGTDEEYQAAVFDTYPTILRDTVLWSTLGNHDAYTANGAPYFNIFTLPQSGEGGGTPSGTESYYSFDYGNIHFVCLDAMLSDRTPGSPMLTWLEADLASTSQMWIIAFWHHPPYTKGSHDSDWETELVQMREHAVPILEAGGVDLVLCGHSHSYERSFLLNGHYGLSTTLTPEMIKDRGDGREDGHGAYEKDSAPHAGAIYIVAGSSGKISGGALNHPVMFTSINELGSLILDVDGVDLRARFLNADGAVRDHFSISKAGDGNPPLVTLTATVPVTAEQRVAPGRMTLTRSRDFQSPLAVTLSIGGTARPDLDYQPIASPFTIPAGAANVSFFVQPKPDQLAEGPETVTVTAAPGPGYRVEPASNRSTVLIKDVQMEEWRVAKFGADAGDSEIAGDDADPDGDRETNGAEFIAGTEPRDAKSFFHLKVSVNPAGQAELRFDAQAGRTYSVLFKNTLADPTWQKLADVLAEEGQEIMMVDLTARSQQQRFYRVVAPAIP